MIRIATDRPDLTVHMIRTLADGSRYRADNMVDFTELNDYSQRFAAVLFAGYPEWQKLSSVDTAEGVDEGSLLVTVAPPMPRDINGPLHISTDGGELTVGFDIYHTHFHRYADDEEAEAFAEAMAFIADVLAERIAVISWWDGDTWRGSSTFAPSADPAKPSWVSDAKTVRTRSWTGKFDRDAAV